MITRANVADLRRAAEMSNQLVKAGVLFVPMPVLNGQDYQELAEQANARLDKLAQMAEDEA
ncbi:MULTISPECIES: DUF1382 family protein [Pseudomonas]|uniref:DUF1382 family protein n=1 Tax=Pseudomonas TaxID=286 RepID=UPI002592A454|nr:MULTISPECIES: DUF1382 family protein [Pseudomonas]